MVDSKPSVGKEQGSQDILLVHGLGGWKSRLAIRSLVFALNLRLNKPKIYAFTPKWQTDERAEHKLERLQSYWESKNKPTTLVGISAGANPVRFLALTNRDVNYETHLVAGYAGNGSDISDKHQAEAPEFAFVAKLTHAQLSVTPEDTSAITLHLPTDDDVIAKHNLVIPGAHQESIPRAGHSSAIAWWLLHQLPKLAS